MLQFHQTLTTVLWNKDIVNNDIIDYEWYNYLLTYLLINLSVLNKVKYTCTTEKWNWSMRVHLIQNFTELQMEHIVSKCAKFVMKPGFLPFETWGMVLIISKLHQSATTLNIYKPGVSMRKV